MKVLFCILYCIIIFVKVHAQNRFLHVDYIFSVVTPKGESFKFYKSLYDNGTKSIFINKDTAANSGPMVMRNSFKADLGIYVDKSDNFLLQYYPILGRDYYIKDDSLTGLLKWNTIPTTEKEIMGFRCKTAKCRFRGRDYIVYYTDKIPFFTGPWKLIGLPGTILEAYTVDGMYKFTAYKVTISPGFKIIANPYDDKKLKYLSFSEHKAIFRKKVMDLQRKAQTQEKDEDVTYTFDDNSIELITDK